MKGVVLRILADDVNKESGFQSIWVKVAICGAVFYINDVTDSSVLCNTRQVRVG